MFAPAALLLALPLAAAPAPPAGGGLAREPLPAPLPGSVRAARYAAWADDLGADAYATREAAAGRLRRAGADAADVLVAAARDADPERRTRAAAALSDALTDAVGAGRTAEATALIDALRRLFDPAPPADDPLRDAAPPDAAPQDSVAAAAATLGRFRTAVTAAALRTVRSLGAVVMPQEIRGLGRVSYSVTLDDRWRGGEDGLRHLRLIGDLARVYVTDDALPEAAKKALDAGEFGRFSVERRGKAFLGIQFDSTVGEGCVIDRLTRGGPADRGGLRPGDRVLKFAGEEIAGPTSLLVAIREKAELGVPTPVTVRRRDGGRESETTLTVTLGRWPDGAQTFDGDDPFGPRGVPFNPAAPRFVPFRPRVVPGPDSNPPAQPGPDPGPEPGPEPDSKPDADPAPRETPPGDFDGDTPD